MSDMPSFSEGDIVVAALPQADGQRKGRPVVILKKMPPFDDFLCCGISSQIHHEVEGFDEIIEEDDDDFADSGLKRKGLIRLGFLATLFADHIDRTIGTISQERLDRLCKRLAKKLHP